MSVLRNLAAKGLLEQGRSQAAYVYRSKVTDEEVARGILDAPWSTRSWAGARRRSSTICQKSTDD